MEAISSFTKRKANSRDRFWELDFLRGFCVLAMLLDHTIKQIDMFTSNVYVISALDVYFYNPAQPIIHAIIRIIFFLVCGVSSRFSRSNYKRGIQLLCIGCALTVITSLLDTTIYFSYTTIIFGVFYMLGIGIILLEFIQRLSKHIPYVGDFIPIICGVLWLVFYYCYIDGKAGNRDFGLFPALFGYSVTFASADYAPLFPDAAYILLGAGLGLFYKTKYKNALKRLDGKWNKPVCFVGRHALAIYLLQPILIGGICFLIFHSA